jgi:hypothetical protein
MGVMVLVVIPHLRMHLGTFSKRPKLSLLSFRAKEWDNNYHFFNNSF